MHLTPDGINGVFEFVGSLLIWINVRALYHDKEFKGVRIGPTAFFFCWGLWNLFFYPHLGQYLSFAGGVSMVIANLVWVAQMVYYGRFYKAPISPYAFAQPRLLPTGPGNKIYFYSQGTIDALAAAIQQRAQTEDENGSQG
jgi:hypothetical protein